MIQIQIGTKAASGSGSAIYNDNDNSNSNNNSKVVVSVKADYFSWCGWRRPSTTALPLSPQHCGPFTAA